MSRRLLLVAALGLTACGNDNNDGSVVHDLVVTANEPPGSNCPSGGVAIESGADVNDDSTLDASEVTQTSYVCAIATGQGGIKVVAKTTAESAGANCTYGGTRVDIGVDDSGNGTLEDGEIDSTQYVCDKAPTTTGGGGVATYGDVVIVTDADLTQAQSIAELHGTLYLRLDRRSAVTDISFPSLVYADGIVVNSANGTVTLSLPALTHVGTFTLDGQSSLLTGLSINAPALTTSGDLNFSNIALTGISMPALHTAQNVLIRGTALTALALPALSKALTLNTQYNYQLNGCAAYDLLFQLADAGTELATFAADPCSDTTHSCHPAARTDGSATDFAVCAESLSQSGGHSACASLGANWTLAYFDSGDEFTTFVAETVLVLPRMWIGYQDPGGTGTFVWSDDAADTYLPTSANSEFWYPGEPASVGTNLCSELRLTTNVGKADTQACGGNFPALCRELPL